MRLLAKWVVLSETLCILSYFVKLVFVSDVQEFSLRRVEIKISSHPGRDVEDRFVGG